MPTPSLFWRSFLRWAVISIIDCAKNSSVYVYANRNLSLVNEMAICQALTDKTVSIDFNFFPWCVFVNFSDTTGNNNRKLNVGLRLKYALTFFELSANLQKYARFAFFNTLCGLFTNHTFYKIHIFFVDPRLQSVALMIFMTWTSLNTSCTVMSIVPPIIL